MVGMDKGKGRANWRLVSPEAVTEIGKRTANPHPGDLSGKRVILYWNGKPNGDVFLVRIGQLMAQRIPDSIVIKAWEVLPFSKETDQTREASRAAAEQIGSLKPDIVIAAPGDCVGSATWLIIDQLNLERMGVPTVTIVTSPFSDVARSVTLAEGFGDVCLVPISPPLGMIPHSEAEKKAQGAFDEIVKAAVAWKPAGKETAGRAAHPAETFDFRGTIEELNSHFVEKGWSLGLPILPPTRGRVDEIAGGCARRSDDVLGLVPPAMGILTIELAAVYAAMAGCRPSYMPLLVAALEAFLAPEANWRLALSGTGTSQLIAVVDGPVVREIGLASGQGAAGKGHHANGAVGYALNLIAYGVGGSRPPSMDRSTLGSPSDYVCWVFGENEDALPDGWDPLHVERGFARNESVVTVMAGYPPIENMDHWSESAEEHVRWWGSIVSPLQNMGGPPIPQVMEQNPLIALGPEHARLIAASGWSKDDFKRAFWEKTRTPLSAWPRVAVGERARAIFGSTGDDALAPVTLAPEQLLVIVAGGDGKQSHYFAPLPGAFPISRPIGGRLS